MSELIPHREISPVESYTPRRHIYTRAFEGTFRRWRQGIGGLLLLIYFATAWLNADGRQAVWWDLPSRQFHVFGATFWPQDFILLSGVLIVSAFGLFCVTVYAGRVWCGYSCPQSVWTWLFMWCEKVTEGDRLQRIRLDQAPASLPKLLRKAAKHGLWLLLALATGLTFVGYFTPIRELAVQFFLGQADAWAYVWVGLLGAATYANAGWLREQVCIHMCPYARFQSVMLDADTLTVAYQPRRGEPRGPRRRDADPTALGLGDCVDCTLCVQVCPTGIDIRDGLQIECIGCAACVDACDSVMDKLGYPRGLVGYHTEHALAGQPERRLRPRLLAHAGLLLVLLGVLAGAFILRPLAALDVRKDRMLYRYNAAGQIENVYSLRVLNKDRHEQVYRLAASGPAGLEWHGQSEVRVAAGGMFDLVVRLSLPADPPPAPVQPIRFDLSAPNLAPIATDSRFSGPPAR
jgi:cytochrome c oxidase accessory protein FixG